MARQLRYAPAKTTHTSTFPTTFTKNHYYSSSCFLSQVSCYFINYKVFVNIVKYKLDHMRKRMETEERDATSRSSFRCTRSEPPSSPCSSSPGVTSSSQTSRQTSCSTLSLRSSNVPIVEGEMRRMQIEQNSRNMKIYFD